MYSSWDDSQIGPNNQEKGDLDFNSVILSQNGDEHLEIENMTLTNTYIRNTSTNLESLITNIPNQLIVEDVHDLIFELIKNITISSYQRYS